MVSAMPSWMMCGVCDHELGDNPSESGNQSADRLGVSPMTVQKHRKADHDNNPEWHAKRAAWWANELAALEA